MKKRILTWLLAISMLGSLLTVPAGAAAVTKFSDVSDSYTATAVESLRLMGVLDGYGDGTFRPDTVLNRAQFCKMAVYAMNGSNELGRYRTVTVFSDGRQRRVGTVFHRYHLPGREALSLGVRLHQHGIEEGNHLRLCRR